jgi:hypothetical protein
MPGPKNTPSIIFSTPAATPASAPITLGTLVLSPLRSAAADISSESEPKSSAQSEPKTSSHMHAISTGSSQKHEPTECKGALRTAKRM